MFDLDRHRHQLALISPTGASVGIVQPSPPSGQAVIDIATARTVGPSRLPVWAFSRSREIAASSASKDRGELVSRRSGRGRRSCWHPAGGW